MNEIMTLLSLELRSLYGINKHLHTRDKKAKNRYRALSLVWVILIAMVFVYVGGLVWGLCSFGLEKIAPAYLAAISSIIILIFGIFKGGERLFSAHGYDIIAAMPIKTESVVISRILSLYFEDILLALLVMLPGAVVYGIYMTPDLGFYLAAAVSVLLIPAIPLVISSVIGTITLALSSRMRRSSIVQSVLLVAIVVAVLTGSFAMENTSENLTAEAFTRLADTIGKLIGKVYPPALWMGNAMTGTSYAGLAYLALISAVLMCITVFAVSKCFHGIIRRLSVSHASHSFKMGRQDSHSLLYSLYIREARRYFSSSIYVTNTIVGPILGTVMAVAISISGMDFITKEVSLPIDITALLPFVLAAVFSMMTTTSVSISMEGGQIWLVKSLPIPPKVLYDSKILFNLTLVLPFFFISAVSLWVSQNPSPSELLWLYLVPLSVILFSVVCGIAVNLKFHSFDWEKEETVVKQSLSAMVGGFAGFIASTLSGFAVFLTPDAYVNITKGAVCVILLTVTVILYRMNNKKSLCEL